MYFNRVVLVCEKKIYTQVKAFCAKIQRHEIRQTVLFFLGWQHQKHQANSNNTQFVYCYYYTCCVLLLLCNSAQVIE